MKKFFKILMVFALLSGAALSCTKDYSKEIKDVQTQSQELKALIESLQTALNSTNATVASLKNDLATQSGQISELQSKHAADIKTLTDKATELESQITTLKSSVAANAKDISDIKTTLGEIAVLLGTLETEIETNATAIAANKELIVANQKAIAAAQAEIEKLWEAVGKLSARLTNIVAAPAKTTEVQTIKVGEEIVRTIINMDFVVAPASAAEAIAAKFGQDTTLALTYTLYNGLDRAHQTKAPEYAVTVNPYRVVCQSQGVISVSAVFEDSIIDPTKSLYATLTVAGKDEAGAFERVSDPVKPICDGTKQLFDALKWYKGTKLVAVKTAETEIEAAEKAWNAIKDAKTSGKGEAADTAFVVGKQLLIANPDYDWKTLPQANVDILANGGYELKWYVTDDQIFTIAEAAELLNIPYGDVYPHFTAFDEENIVNKDDYAPIEWEDFVFQGQDPVEFPYDVFTAKGDTTSLWLALEVELEGTDPEKAHYVGAFTHIATGYIALGEQVVPGCNVNYVQRICKHESKQKAADALTARFAFNAGKVEASASQSDTTFSSVVWKSTTDISRHGVADIYVVKNGQVTTTKNGEATVREMSTQSKFAHVTIREVKFDKDPQTLRIVWANDSYKNQFGVVTEVYTDYIDLDVEAYHAPVALTAVADTVYLSHTVANKIPTDLTVKSIFEGDASWFLTSAKAADLGEQGKLINWFTIRTNDHKPKAKTITPAISGKDEVFLTVENGKIVLNAPANTLLKFKDGKDYTITVCDTLDKVIAFQYTIKFTPKKFGVTIETIPGYVKNDSVYVNGNSVRVGGSWAYRIDDINLTQYYRLANLDQRNKKDSLTAVFATKANVTFDGPQKWSKAYDWTLDQTGTKGVIKKSAKISWNGYEKNYFDLKAVAALNGDAAHDSISVRFWTAAPVYVKNATGEGTMKVGEKKTFDLFEDFDVRGIVDTTINLIDNHTIYSSNAKDIVIANSEETPDYGFENNSDLFRAPEVSDWTLWTCYVDGVEYPNDQMQELFDNEPTWDVYHRQRIGYSDYYAYYNFNFREHSAPATITFVIPCTWKYAIGTLKFNYVFTLVVE